MSQTLACNYIHLVFSTKERREIIPKTHKKEVFAYIAKILNNTDCTCISAGGTANHVHLLFILSKTKSLSEVVRTIKSNTSKWIHEHEGLRNYFAWQDGYGAFSVSATQIDKVMAYIENQEEHHKHITFQDEFRKICAKNNAMLDERIAWI